MVYEGDFYSNFEGAVKSKDREFVLDMLSDEISSLVSDHRSEVLKLFPKGNIEIQDNPSNEIICNKICENIVNNSILRVGISYLINEYNSDEPAKKKDDKSESKASKQKQLKKTTDIASSISDSLEDISPKDLINFKNSLINKSNNKAPNFSETSNSNLNEELAKKQKAEQQEKKIDNIIYASVILSACFYAYKKGWFKGLIN